MDKSGVIVGGITGAVIVLVVFVIIMIPQPNAIKPEIVVTNGHDLSVVGEIFPSYSKKLSLIEIFEKSEAGVVKVNI